MKAYRKISRRNFLKASAGSSAALLLAACGASSSSSSEAAASSAAASSAAASSEAASDVSSFPLTVQHAYGETVIEAKPERVVTIAWENEAPVLALGIVPVGVSAANYGHVTDHRLHAWTDEAFAALGEEEPNVFDDTDGWDYEAIADANPDVILCVYSGITQEEYDLLSEIAPVVSYTAGAWMTHWRDQTTEIANALGMAEKGEQLVADTESVLAEKLAAHPEIEGTNAAFCWISADDFSTFYVYLPTDPRAAYLNDLGMVIPDSVLDLAEDASSFAVTVSRENADLLADVDLMIVYGDSSMLDALQADELMSKIPAIANGAMVFIDETSDLAGAATPSVLSIPYVIDDYLDLISAAAANIPANAQ